MNVLYIDHYAGSLRDGMEFRPFYMAREWQKKGHKVRIIGADFSHLRTRQPIVKKNYSKEYIDGIEYQWVKAGTYDRNGVKRALSMFKFVSGLWVYAHVIAKEFKPDIIITSSTYPLDSYAGYRIAKLSKAKYIHEAHDVWPLTLVELGGMSSQHPFVQMLDHAEKYAYKHCDKVISLLPDVLPHMLEQRLGSEEKFVYIPNGIVLDDWDNPEELDPKHKTLFTKLRAENKTIILYIGGHAMSNALDQLLDAAKRIEADDVVFVLIGKGVEKKQLQDRAVKEKISNVFFLPPVSKKQVPSALSEADALYIGASHCSLYRFGVSMNKIYDYMMAGKPILNGVVASNNEIQEADCGISFDSSKPDEIISAILCIKTMDKDRLRQLGNNGRSWVIENRDYSKLANSFLEHIL